MGDHTFADSVKRAAISPTLRDVKNVIGCASTWRWQRLSSSRSSRRDMTSSATERSKLNTPGNTMIHLLGLRYPDGYAVVRWIPRWTGGELPGRDTAPLIDDVDEQHDFAHQAVQYLLVLGLLAEAENSPLRIEIDKATKVRHVYLSDRALRPREVETTDAIEGRVADAVVVSGHLKRQRHGPGNALVKTIYVAGHSARRWFASRWVVSERDEPS